MRKPSNSGGRAVLGDYCALLRTGGLAGLMIFCLPPSPGFAARVPIRDGQTVTVKLRSILTTDNVRKGDLIEFEVGEDILVSGHVVIAKGAPARGKVVEVKGAFRPRATDAEVVFEFLTVRAADNVDLPVRPHLEKSRKGGAMEIHEKSVIPGQISRVVGADKGKEYEVYVDGSFTVNVSEAIAAAPTASPTAPLLSQTSAPAAASPAPPTAGPEAVMATSSVAFESTPDGAEIVIDGNLVGNTPSTLRLSAGRHAIEIRMAGYRTWSRSMIVDPESHPSVRATLINQ
jgi:hypothetical protein